jgi:hypothetical protein
MNLSGKKITFLALSSVVAMLSFGQVSSSTTGGQIVNTVTTAVPFLRIVNDTRSGGMGDVGVAMSPDANGAQLNGAKMAFIDKDYGFGLSFSPWLKALVNDIYLANITGFYNIKRVQTIHASLRYFSLGKISFTDDQGNAIRDFTPNELALDVGYSRKLGKIVSVGATLRFIYSNLATGVEVGGSGNLVRPGYAGAADISFMVDKTFGAKKGNMTHQLFAGMNISNIGSKISYTSSTTKDYIPTNLALGLGYNLNIDKNSTVGVYFDLNKLLVPTPIPPSIYTETSGPNKGKIKAEYDKNANGVADYREANPITGIFQSFSTKVPGGVTEKFNELNVSVGAEYFYKKMFGVRAGYFYENPYKGNRQFFTVGATIKYSIAGLHLSYLVPTSNIRNPLDNTFRLSFTFEFTKGQFKKKDTEENPSAEPLPMPSPEKIERSNKKKSLNKTDLAPVQQEPATAPGGN